MPQLRRSRPPMDKILDRPHRPGHRQHQRHRPRHRPALGAGRRQRDAERLRRAGGDRRRPRRGRRRDGRGRGALFRRRPVEGRRRAADGRRGRGRARLGRYPGQQCRHPASSRRSTNSPTTKWDAIIAINLASTFHAIKAALPGMKARNWGRIINIASAHGLVASPFKSAYVAAKHGVVGLTKTVALEIAEHGDHLQRHLPRLRAHAAGRGADRARWPRRTTSRRRSR